MSPTSINHTQSHTSNLFDLLDLSIFHYQRSILKRALSIHMLTYLLWISNQNSINSPVRKIMIKLCGTHWKPILTHLPIAKLTLTKTQTELIDYMKDVVSPQTISQSAERVKFESQLD